MMQAEYVASVEISDRPTILSWARKSQRDPAT